MLIATFVAWCCLFVATTSDHIGKFWHVTDFHYDHTYFSSQLSCNDDVPEPGFYGDYWCDSPWNLVQSAVDFMADMTGNDPDVDFAIWTGDTVAHISDDDLTFTKNMEILQRVTGALEAGMPGIPVYASLGNHDFYPSDQAEGQRSDIYERVGDMWKDWISSQAQVDKFEEGGFYAKTLSRAPDIRLLALNTNLYYTSNDVTPEIADPAGQFAWMEAQLEEAKAANQTVMLTGHVPPGLLTPDLVNWFYPAHKQRFMEIVFKYSDVIAATHFGHDHHDGFKILQNENGSSAVPQYTAPSVTPWRYRFSTPTGEQIGAPHNPAVRLVEYDRHTGVAIDIHQYFINLTDSNANNQTRWSKLYSFRQSYGVPDLGVASLRRIFDKIKDGGSREVTSQFCRFSVVSREEKPCTDLMRGQIYCGGLYYDLDQAKTCVDGYLSRINGVGLVTASLSLTLAAITIASRFMSV